MATAVATKPSAPHQQQKMKRPPPPAVQTNGIQTSQTSPSPSTASKRIPSASSFKAPPTPTLNGSGAGINGVGSRNNNNNRRRESQRPGDPQGRTRSGRDGERKAIKKRNEPYVKDQGYILKKYKDCAPSLTLHLHATLFRFDQQDGSFSYNSPMKAVLEHIKNQTIPHDLLEDLYACGVRFYEGCLIVQIKDHRHAQGQGKSTSSDAEANGFNKPFSIHNYSNFVTPSPYVEYPEQKSPSSKTSPSSSEVTSGPQSEETLSDKQKNKDPEPKTYTVVLFPTPLTLTEEVMIQANTPDTKPGNRKQSHTVPRTPASATVPHTPLSAVPPTPSTSGPIAKKQKMSITGSELQEFESKLIAANAPPLFLDIVSDLEESQQALEKLTDAQHRKEYPAPKSRKRTVAELAADEAQAASDQAFMLIMDERLGPAMSANGAKTGSADEAGTATFEPSFERFNAIQAIKARHEQMARDKAIQEAEAKRQKDRLDQERAEQQAQAQAHAQAQAANAARLQANMQDQRNVRVRQAMQEQEFAHRQQRIAAAAAAAAQNQPNAINHGHHVGIGPNGVSQAQHSSPVIRNATPHGNASPSLATPSVTQNGSLPMNVTSSGQGAPSSSPTRPPSTVQQNPAAQAMNRQNSRQQLTSRTSTPHLNGTPNIPHATPNIGHATPVMPQGSPPNPPMQTPVMGNPQMAGHPNGVRSQLTPQQMAEMQQRRQFQQQQAFLQMQSMQNQAHPQNSPPQQMSPERRQAMQNFAAQRVQEQHAYQRSLAQHHAAGALSQNGAHGHPQVPNGMSQHGQGALQQGHPGQQPHPQQAPLQRTPVNPVQARHAQLQRTIFTREVANVANQKYGGNLALMTQEDQQAATHQAFQQYQMFLTRERTKQQHQQQQQRQHQQQILAQMQLQGQGLARPGGMQGLTQQQFMQQFAQMQNGGGGMQNMNTMNAMGGMNGMNGALGNGMGDNGMNGM